MLGLRVYRRGIELLSKKSACQGRYVTQSSSSLLISQYIHDVDVVFPPFFSLNFTIFSIRPTVITSFFCVQIVTRSSIARSPLLPSSQQIYNTSLTMKSMTIKNASLPRVQGMKTPAVRTYHRSIPAPVANSRESNFDVDGKYIATEEKKWRPGSHDRESSVDRN